VDKISKYLKAEKIGEWTRGNGGFIDGKWLAKDLNLHTNDGYKLVECPKPVEYIINKLQLRSQVEDINNSFDIWTIKVAIKMLIDFSERELADLLGAGVTNIRFDSGKLFIRLKV